MEIFNSRWEYFKVIFWGISPPDITKEFGEKPNRKDIQKEFAPIFKGHKHTPDDLKAISENLNTILFREEKRKDTIEEKAHSLLSISGITITLFAGGISILLSQFIEANFLALFSIYLFLIIPMINLVGATLLARRVVVLEYGIPAKTILEAIDLSFSVDSVIEKIYSIRLFEYINDIKGSFLKWAHWYYKATFVLLMISALGIPVITLFLSIGEDNLTSDGVQDTIRIETQHNHTKNNVVDQHKTEINFNNQSIEDDPKSSILEKSIGDSSKQD